MGFGIIPTFLLMLAVTLSHAADCPAKYKELSAKHTFCLPENKDCKIVKRGVTDADKAIIVQVHNELRSKIATGKETKAGGLPPATNMLEMVWDDEIASIAQKLAETCKFNHDCNKCRAVKAFSVGQNIHLGGRNDPPKDADWKSAIESFYSEISTFNKNNIKPFVNGKYGHFSQVVWAKSWKIGCGYTVYQEGDKYKSLKVCNYGPAGNVGGSEMYEAGKTCSACPKDFCCGDSSKSKYKGLCKHT